MACLLWMMWALAGDLPQVQVETLKSGQAAGELKQMTATRIVVGDKHVPLSEVLEIRFPAPVTLAPVPGAPASSSIEVVLADGSRIPGAQITVAGSEVKLTSIEFGTTTIRKNVLRSLRFGATDAKLDEAWQKILDRDSKKDLIVVRKDDKLDFLAGVAGEIDAQTVKFLVDGEEVPVKRERVYGLIYQPAAFTGKTQAIMELLGVGTLQTKQIVTQDQNCLVILASGVTMTVPLNRVKFIDFSLGKIRQLSQMTPSDVKYVYYWDEASRHEFRKDSGPTGQLITLGGERYPKGLSIHSKARLTFRLQGEYRRFQTTLGIDDNADDTGTRGDVTLTILGDDKPLLETEVKGPDAPRKVDLDVTNVRELQILVDFGGDLDIADWLSLGDAKVIK